MFLKPFKVKSNNTLKNSEKKNLIQRLHNEYPNISEEKTKELVSVKSNTSYMKLALHNGDTVGLFVVENCPLLLDLEEGLVPTVYALWIVPDMLPSITIHTPVLTKLIGGARLFPAGIVGFCPRGLVSINTEGNRASAGVGRGEGGSVTCLQLVGDMLARETRFGKRERPKLGPPVLVGDVGNPTPPPPSLPKEEWPSLTKEAPTQPAVIPNEPRVITAQPDNSNEQRVAPGHNEQSEVAGEETLEDIMKQLSVQKDPDADIPEDMDSLLRWTLLSFIKVEAKNVELPLKTNLLYKNYLMPLCPPGRTLDVKKSSYKKMSKFLDAMQQEGLIEVRELEKGVSSLTATSPSHVAVRCHRAPTITTPANTNTNPGGGNYVPPLVRELFCVTAHVLPVFTACKKGTALSGSEVRAAVTHYVKTRSLDRGSGTVEADDVIAKISRKPVGTILKWEEVMSSVTSTMTPCTEFRYSDGSVALNKTKMEPVKMQLATRSGNKKVTIVSNLHLFGFNIIELCREWQRAAAASCSVVRSAASATDQLQLQGDQTYFVAKTLTETYRLPKKFVDGADKALKKKPK